MTGIHQDLKQTHERKTVLSVDKLSEDCYTVKLYEATGWRDAHATKTELEKFHSKLTELLFG